jgi:hypothetical protein
MGVDISLKVRIINPENQKSKEIEISEQDNSLASLLSGNTEIRYTSIKIENEGFLTENEFNKIKLNYDEAKEMVEESTILDAVEASIIFDKMYQYFYRKKRDALNNDLNKIDTLDLSFEAKDKRKQSQIGEYYNFEHSFGLVQGVIKTAKELNWNVQLVGEYY